MIRLWLMLLATIVSLSAYSFDLIALYRLENAERIPFQLKGDTEYVALYYSASWCPPCRKPSARRLDESIKIPRYDLGVKTKKVGENGYIYQRLLEKGKPKKLAVIAVMQKAFMLYQRADQKTLSTNSIRLMKIITQNSC